MFKMVIMLYQLPILASSQQIVPWIRLFYQDKTLYQNQQYTLYYATLTSESDSASDTVL